MDNFPIVVFYKSETEMLPALMYPPFGNGICPDIITCKRSTSLTLYGTFPPVGHKVY